MRSCPVGLLFLLVGLLVGGAPAGAAAEPSQPSAGSGIRIQCVPGYMRLGTDREAEVHIELEPSATGLELFVSRGEVRALTQVKPGVFRASYVPPKQSLPQEVILAAVARGPQGGSEGWMVLPLWGQGEAEVRTRAGAPVTLQVGDQTYGPVQADAAGLARISVWVPPGVNEAFFGRKRIELGVPPRPFVHALAERRELRADREETVNIRLYFLKGQRKLPPPGAFTFSATRGTVGSPTEVGPGVFALPWTVPPGPAGTLELEGTARGDPRWSFSVQLEAVPGPARRFETRVEPEVPARDAVRHRPVLLVSTRAGVVTNFAEVLAPSAGLRLESWPVLPLPDLGLMLDTGYLRFSLAGGERVPGFSGHNELLDVTVALALRTPWEKGLQGWVAAGPTVARVLSRASLGEGPVLEEGTWVLGAQALVGAGFPLGRGLPFLEARFCWFDDPSLYVLRGALRGGGLHVGYRLELF
jgi:hypothetical protein